MDEKSWEDVGRLQTRTMTGRRAVAWSAFDWREARNLNDCESDFAENYQSSDEWLHSRVDS